MNATILIALNTLTLLKHGSQRLQCPRCGGSAIQLALADETGIICVWGCVEGMDEKSIPLAKLAEAIMLWNLQD